MRGRASGGARRRRGDVAAGRRARHAHAVPDGSPLLFCPFCEESFEDESRCPEHDLELVPLARLAALRGKYVPEGDETLAFHDLRFGRGVVLLAGALWLAAFAAPFMEVSANGDLRRSSGFELATTTAMNLWLLPMLALGLRERRLASPEPERPPIGTPRRPAFRAPGPRKRGPHALAHRPGPRSVPRSRPRGFAQAARGGGFRGGWSRHRRRRGRAARASAAAKVAPRRVSVSPGGRDSPGAGEGRCGSPRLVAPPRGPCGWPRAACPWWSRHGSGRGRRRRST